MISLLQILEQCDLTDYDICFVQIGKNDVKTAKDDPLGLNNPMRDTLPKTTSPKSHFDDLMHALINIV